MAAKTALEMGERPETACAKVFPSGTVADRPSPSQNLRLLLTKYFEAMSLRLGPMKWWPAKTAFEVIVGAILTQNTAWTNVELALANLRRERLLSVPAIAHIPEVRLAKLIRPSGYYRQKAKKLKAFVEFLARDYDGSLKRMAAAPTSKLREQLLAVHGIGPETADSILLYAAEHPVFVVDAYTKRLLERHGLLAAEAKYGAAQSLFMQNLPNDAKIFNEYHALIVEVGKRWCRSREPRCEECPLGEFLDARPSHMADLRLVPLNEVRA